MNRTEKLAREIISDAGLESVAQAIKSFETRTSGEIVISFNTNSGGQPYKRARQIFKRQKLYETKERNAILIALYLEERSFAVFGDAGIHDRLGVEYWQSTVKAMSEHFTSGDLATGLVWAINELGERLAEFFPLADDDQNELSDDLRFEEGA